LLVTEQAARAVRAIPDRRHGPNLCPRKSDMGWLCYAGLSRDIADIGRRVGLLRPCPCRHRPDTR